jgi:hypothetical protein
MASRERKLLEQISNGKTSWGPADNSREALETFQAEAEDFEGYLGKPASR